MIHPSDRQTDGQTDGRAIAYTRYSIHAIARKSPLRASRAHGAALISVSCSPQPDTSQSRKTTDTGLVYHAGCPFTPQRLQVLINWPRRDGTLSWR